jgi:hypothetical protein
MEISKEPEALDSRLLVSRTGTTTAELRSAVDRIRDNKANHKRLLKLATFSLPDEEKQAHAVRQQLRDYYGPEPSIEGLVFSVATAVDNSEQYLGVYFDPDKIEEGALEIWLEEKAARARAAKNRRTAVDGYVANIVTMEDLNKTWESNGGDLDNLGAAIERARERVKS